MTKSEINAMAIELEELRNKIVADAKLHDMLRAIHKDMLETIDCLDHDQEVRVVEKPGRKDEVLAILMTGKHVSVSQIAKIVGINERNVSSQLSYLRKDGKRIATDSRGLKFLES